MKIRFENSNILADFDKIDNYERSKNTEKSKFQDLLRKIFRSPQYLSPKPKLALLDQSIGTFGPDDPYKNSCLNEKICYFSKSAICPIFVSMAFI